MTPKRRVVVVDGSNLATEGRTTPSLVQLDECVRAFQEEEPNAEIIVVVDATFDHRIAKEERDRFRDALMADEIVTPPGGTVGRGDAFILKIAERAKGVVLSNDSFQEFHAEHPWLFDEGRLIGGKPIPGVGWIFTPRNPVKGPKSRAVRARAAASGDEAEDTEVPVAAPALRRRASATRAKDTSDADQPSPAASSAPRPAASKRTRRAASPAAAAKRAAKSSVTAEAKPRAESTKKAGGRDGAPAATTTTTTTTTTKRASAAKVAPSKRSTRSSAAQAAPASKVAPPVAKARSSALALAPAKAETTTKRAAHVAVAVKGRSIEPANSARAFQALVASHPLRSKVEGEVTTFTSHGAMITIPLGRGLQALCYAPLAGLGRPAPQRARDVLKKGERRTFRVVAFDADRRIAELALSKP